MINKSQKLRLLKNIFESPEFNGSNKKYSELLKYLAEASEKGEPVKETTIAIDVFGKDASFNSNEDPIVRVYISNLRKKIDHYFLTEGKNEKFRLEIPKGHYHVEFVPVGDAKRKNKKKELLNLWFVPVIIILAAAFLYLWMDRNRIQKDYLVMPLKNPIWSEILQKNDYPTIVVIGDYYFLCEKMENLGRWFFIRDPRINALEDFENLIEKYPNIYKRYMELDYTYLQPSSIWSIVQIFPILWQSRKKIFLKLASDLKWEDMSRHNVIFVGSFKSLFKLNELLKKLHFRYQLDQPQLFVINDQADTLKTFKTIWGPKGYYRKDYAVVVKYPGPHDTIILLIIGFDETSVIEATKTISNPLFVSQLENQFLEGSTDKPLFFEFVLEVEGIDRTGFKSEIKHFHKISAESQITNFTNN